jgi:hypothetical protein
MVSIAPPHRRHPATTWWLAAVGLVVALTLSLGSARGAPVLTHALPNRQLIQVHWMRVDPLHPRTLFASGAGFCHNIQRPSDYQPICPLWLMRSLDGGTTWQDLGSVLSAYPSVGQGYLAHALIAPDGHHVYVPSGDEGITPYGAGSWFFASADRGAHWYGSWGTGSSGGGIVSIAFSPASPSRLYAVYQQDPTEPGIVKRSDEAGRLGTWRNGTSPLRGFTPRVGIYRPWGGLVADPVHENTLYANIVNLDTGRSTPAFVTRSEDAGLHWSRVMTPTASPPLHTFRVSTDTHAGTALVGRTDDPEVPADRRYLSDNAGRTWRPTTCPGDLQGSCPTFIVDNVFEAGASYAFTAQGIYRFHDGGPAETRLAISDRLPVPISSLMDVEAGRHVGDPVYLLARSVRDRVQGVLYRSTDAGQSWQRLALGVLPSMAAPSHAPGALSVPHARHSVAPPFVATYRRLGPYLLGQPVTEAYREAEVLTQDFEHLRLQVRQGHVVAAHLGAEVYPYESTGGRDPFGRAAPAMSPRRYFRQTGHAVQGEFLRFWEAHDGTALFGAPISDIVFDPNGDGSGRVYAMQWFEKARLEWHPETRDPHFTVFARPAGPRVVICARVAPSAHA